MHVLDAGSGAHDSTSPLCRAVPLAGNGCVWRQDEQAARMGLGTTIMGSKEDDKVKVKDLVEVM